MRKLTFNPDGSRLAAALGYSGYNAGTPGLMVWDAANGKLVHSYGLPGPSTVAYSPDGSRLVL